LNLLITEIITHPITTTNLQNNAKEGIIKCENNDI